MSETRKLKYLPELMQKNFMTSLWDNMEGYYGASFTRKFGEVSGGDLPKAGLKWREKLSGFRTGAITRAIEACEEAHPDRPPTLMQFMKLCKIHSKRSVTEFTGVIKRRCEYRKGDRRCDNEGTMSTNVNGEGPWLCKHHHLGGSGFVDITHESAILDYGKAHAARHPELQRGYSLAETKMANLDYIFNKLGPGGKIRDMLPELPYDKRASVAKEDGDIPF